MALIIFIFIFKGVRSEKVGIIDSEYIVHEGIPSLGGQPHDKVCLWGWSSCAIFCRRWKSRFAPVTFWWLQFQEYGS